MSRPIHDRAECQNCPAPLEKSFGRWVHHWLYRNTCQDPTPIPESIELDYGR